MSEPVAQRSPSDSHVNTLCPFRQVRQLLGAAEKDDRLVLRRRRFDVTCSIEADGWVGESGLWSGLRNT
jgi:hypothetical protein